VILFSHGSVNDPINYAHLLERMAAAGFLVAAPSHVTDTQEDVRIDFINPQLPPSQRFPCNDGLAGPCSRPGNTVALRMADRARDIAKVLE
jgi:hypothetical protein